MGAVLVDQHPAQAVTGRTALAVVLTEIYIRQYW